MEVVHPDTGSVIYRVGDIPVDFLPNLHTLLLGVSNLLGDFILAVDYPQQIFSVKYPTQQPSSIRRGVQEGSI